MVSRIIHDARSQESLANNIVWSLYRDRFNNIWIGTDNGMSMLSGLSFYGYTPLADITQSGDGNCLHYIYRDTRRLSLWMGEPTDCSKDMIIIMAFMQICHGSDKFSNNAYHFLTTVYVVSMRMPTVIFGLQQIMALTGMLEKVDSFETSLYPIKPDVIPQHGPMI